MSTVSQTTMDNAYTLVEKIRYHENVLASLKQNVNNAANSEDHWYSYEEYKNEISMYNDLVSQLDTIHNSSTTPTTTNSSITNSSTTPTTNSSTTPTTNSSTTPTNNSGMTTIVQ